MPKTMIDESGNEITAFTEEEVKAFDEQKSKELTEAQQKLEALNQELSKLKEKDLNFSHLRSQKEESEKKVESLKQDFEKQIETVKKEVYESTLKDHYSSMIESLSGGDEETKKKIEYHYNRLSDAATSKAEVEKKLRDAWALSQDRPANTIANSFASFGAAPIKPISSNHKWSDDEKELGKKLAAAGGLVLKDEDFK